MLTVERKQELARKVKFVKDIEAAILNDGKSNIRNIQSLRYEIYEHTQGNISYVEERVVLTFKGDAISVRNCNSTSCAGILKAIADIAQGGYYSEVPYYEQLSSSSDYTRIDEKLEEEYHG